MIVLKTLFVLLLFAASATSSFAAIVNVDSASNTDIQAAIDDAGTVNGDTILTPAGDVTWTGGINFGNKNLTLQGNGVGSTIIRYSGNMITLSNTESRVTGFTIISTGTSTSNYLIHADCDVWFEVDNCQLESGNSTKQIGVHAASPSGGSDPKGVVWNCTFINTRMHVQGDLGAGFGRDIWALSDRVFGSANTVVVEDNTFNLTLSGNVMDDEYGGHYVFRYNAVDYGTIEAHGISSDGERGNKFIEVYNNTITNSSAQTPTKAAFFIRGGSAVVYDNTVTGNWNSTIMVIDSEVRQTNNTTGQGNNVADGNLPTPETTDKYYHTGSNDASVLTAASAGWTTNEWVDYEVFNRTDGSSGIVTANTSDTITATLSGGDNDWDPEDQFYVADTTGTHTGSNGASTLTDSGAQGWTTDEWVNATAFQGSYIYNITDDSLGSITANDGTTVTATLSGGGTWDTGDIYKITNGWPWRDQIGTGTDPFEYSGTPPWPVQAHGLDYAMYEWDNTDDAVDIDFELANGADETAKENRDFFNDTEYFYTRLIYPLPSRSDIASSAISIKSTRAAAAALAN